MGLHPWAWTLVLPWAMAVVWLLRGRGRVAQVPWVRLWPAGPVSGRRKAWRRPPWVVVGGMLACLLAITGAVGFWRAGPSIGPTVVVDRNPASTARYIPPDAGAAIPSPVRLICGNDRAVDDWRAAANASALANDTPASLAAAVGTTVGKVFLVTHRPLITDDPGVVRIDPGPPDSLAIQSLVVRGGSRPQAMVRLNGRGPVTVDSVRQTVDRLGFIDIPTPTQRVTASAGSSTRSAVLVQSTRRLIVDPSAGPAVTRLARAYLKHRPTGDGPFVLVGDHPPDRDGVVVLNPTTPPATGPLRVEPHPVTADVLDWPPGGTLPPPPGYRPVVTRADHPCVAIGPDRSVWIDLSLDDWAESPDFVVFFTNVFDYATGGSPTYTDDPAVTANTDWATATDPVRIPLRDSVPPAKALSTTPIAITALALCLAASAAYYRDHHKPVRKTRR